MIIQNLRRRGVLETLALHHMTPVACRIPNGQKDRLVFGAGAGERFWTPRVPIHRIVGMLKQIRRFFGGKAVGEGWQD